MLVTIMRDVWAGVLEECDMHLKESQLVPASSFLDQAAASPVDRPTAL